MTFIAFVPALSADFVMWDDDSLLTTNPDFRGFGPYQLRWMFTTTLLGNYQPLTWLSFAANHAMSGMKPFGFHLTNVFLHALGATLFFLVARRMLKACGLPGGDRALDLGAAAAALLYAVHPLRVESVAWITERKDVLSAFFLFACVLAWLRSIDRDASPSRRAWYVLALVLFALSLLSKVWGMTLPVILLILNIYPLRRLTRIGRRSIIVELVPFALLAAAAAAGALYAQSTQVGSVVRADAAGRVAQAAWGLVFYLGKLAWPLRLSPIYEHPRPFDPFAASFVAAGAAVVLITTVLVVVRRRWPAGLACWSVYVVVLLPVLGFVQVGPQMAADRYTLLASTPWAVLAGAGLIRLASVGRRAAAAAATVGAVAVLALTVRTWRQCGVWRDTESLWQAALAYDPDSHTAHSGMGMITFGRGDAVAALHHYERARAAAPGHPGITTNLAICLARLGRTTESADLLRRATTMPGVEFGWRHQIAESFAKLGLRDEAAHQYECILSESADDSEAHFQLGRWDETRGNLAGAVAHYSRVVELLEPSVRGGQSDPRIYLDADRFGSACARLVELLTASGEAARADTYRRKLAWIRNG